MLNENARLLTEEDLPWLYDFTVTKGNIDSILEAQDAKSYKIGFLDGYKQGVADQYKAHEMDIEAGEKISLKVENDRPKDI